MRNRWLEEILTRSHAPRGNAIPDAPRRPASAEIRTQSVQDGIPTRSVGTRVTRRLTFSVGGLMLAVAVAGVLLAFVFIPLRRAAMESACKANLQAIGVALNNYHAAYNCFPPAYTTDGQGRPMHSWRVLILPFAGQQALYKAYRFDEPWNGPNNAKLASRMPAFYACPAYDQAPLTSYAVVVGPETLFPGGRSASIAENTDGTGNTISVVEIDGGISWMSPRDLNMPLLPVASGQDFNDLVQESMLDLHRQGFADRTRHSGGVNFLFVDGHVAPGRIQGEPLRAMLTINGSEVWCIHAY